VPKEQKELTIRVTFTQSGECLEKMIQESFRAFIQRNLQNSANFFDKTAVI